MPSFYDVTVANGVPWFSGTNAKSKMRQYVQLYHPDRQSVEIAMQDPVTGYRSYLPFPSWPVAWDALQQLHGHQRHANELITLTRHCKPYLDIDCKGEPEGVAAEDIIPR